MNSSHQQNPDSFSRDAFLFEEVVNLIKKHSVRTIVETGTYHGQTTCALAGMAETVLTVESNYEYFRVAADRLAGKKNVISVVGDSPDIIRQFVPTMTGQFLFFLDAHWGPVWPLKSELEAIRECGLKPVIVVHDFKVGGRPELGFDSYGGLECSWEVFGSSIAAIYGNQGYTKRHPEKVSGGMRGALIVEPTSQSS